MRTTIVLPPELLRAAKRRCAERGESLKALITRAVAAEVAANPEAREARMVLPLFGDPSARKVRVTNADLARHEADADAAGVPVRRRRSPRPRRSRR